MTRRVQQVLTLMVGMIAPVIPLAAENSEIQQARETLEASARAYREVEALRDTLSYVVNAPGSEEETKKEEYAFEPGGAVLVRNALLEAVAFDSKFYLTQSDVPDRYVAAEYAGDFGATLREVAGRGSLFEPPPLVLHTGKGIDACLDTMRFNLLEPWRISGYKERADGKVEIQCVATGGELTLVVDSRTHFFSGVSFQVKPAGAPNGMSVRVDGTFSPEVVSPAELGIHFEPGRRVAVANLADLTPNKLLLGSAAPDFELTTLDGEKIALHDLKGSSLLLDFWATWCVPCWQCLKETQAMADWAATERLPLKVYAVNTMERGSDSNEKRTRVRQFWESQKLKIPMLLDLDGTTFKAFQSPGLPGLILISPSGKILNVHEGIFPNMSETLKREVREGVAATRQ